jgi:hypothetical protein
MTLKEKAQELVSKFEYQEGYGISESTGIYGINFHQAKQCALIAVDEILPIVNKWSALHMQKSSEVIFWEEVKQEIEKL